MFEVQESVGEKIKIYGKEFELKKPTVRELKAITRKLESASAVDSAESTLEFISSLGIPQDFLENMATEHFNLLVKHVLGGLVERKN